MRKVLIASIFSIAFSLLIGLSYKTIPGVAAGQVQPTVGPGFPIGATLIITADSLNLRAGPGVSYGVVGYLSNGDLVTVIDSPASVDGREWYQVSYAGKSGWVSSKYVALYASPSEAIYVATSTNTPAPPGENGSETSPRTPPLTLSGSSFARTIIFFLGSIYWALIFARMGFVYLQETQRYGEKGTGCATALVIFYTLILLSAGSTIGLILFFLLGGVMSLAIIILSGVQVGSALKRRSIKGILTGGLFLSSIVIGIVNDKLGTLAYTAVLCLSLILSNREIKQLFSRVYGIGTG